MTDVNGEHQQTPVERAKSISLRIQSKALDPIAVAFGKAVDNISFLGITPKILVSFGYREAAAFGFFQGLAKTDDITGYSGFDDWFARVSARVEEVAKTGEAWKKFVNHLSETADRHLASLSTDEHVGPALRSLQLSRLILTWGLAQNEVLRSRLGGALDVFATIARDNRALKS